MGNFVQFDVSETAALHRYINEGLIEAEGIHQKRHKLTLCPLYADIAAGSEEILLIAELPLVKCVIYAKSTFLYDISIEYCTKIW